MFTKFIKILAMIAFFLVICSVLTACSSGGSNQNENQSQNSPNGDNGDNIEANTEPATERERPNIPEDTDYGGYEFRFLVPVVYQGESGDFNEVCVEEENGETLNDAVYRRNRIVEELLNVKITTIVGTTWHEMPTSVKTSVQAGSDDFDAIAGAYQPSIAFAGCLENLYNVPGIDLSKPWWDGRMIESLSYKKSKLYYISGDMGYYDKYGIACILFNKRLFADNGLEYPYDKVRSGNWTLDEFSELAKDFARDLNGDGKMDENDQWGLVENSGAALRTLFGCGERIIELDDEGVPYLGAIGERHIRAVMAIGDMMADKNTVLIADSGQLNHLSDPYTDGIHKVFKNSQALFLGSQINEIVRFRDMDDDFGVVPFPKLDEDQKDYHSWTVSYGNGSSYSIPITNTNLERTGMIFEVMAGYSTDIIIPALIDVSLKSKFARDEESAEMLEIIFKSKVYDFAVEYGWGKISWADLYWNVYSQLTLKGSDTFVSSMEKEMAKAEEQTEKWRNTFDEIN